MTLEEALVLRQRIADEIALAWFIRYHEQVAGTCPPDPRATVASDDGEDFAVLVWRGDEIEEYSSPAEWDYGNWRWRQPVFNPDGLWAHRHLMDRRGYGSFRLSCGHSISEELLAPGLVQGAEVECLSCMAEGVGWSSGLIDGARAKYEELMRA